VVTGTALAAAVAGGYNPDMSDALPTGRRVWIPVLATVVGLGLGGCVRRVVEVTSEPSGAIVWMNDREVGTTPCTVEIIHYGTYDVRVEKPGFEPRIEGLRATPPAWDLPGPDLVAEILPTEFVSRNAWHLVLEPEVMDDEAVLQRAVVARDRLLAQERRQPSGGEPTSIEDLQEGVRRLDGAEGPPGKAIGGPLEKRPESSGPAPDLGQAPDIPRPGSDDPGPGTDD